MRDISETKTIKIGDAEFTIGFISRRQWRKMSSRFTEPFTTIKNSRNEDGTFKVSPESMKASEELQDVYLDMIKYSVRDHKNLKRNDGTDISFQKDSDGNVSPLLLDTYDLNNLTAPLGMEVLMFNVMTDSDQKN